MKVRKKTNLIFYLTLIGCLFFSLSRTASGFIPTAHPHQFPNINISIQETLNSKDLLIHKVHEPSWKIGYRFSTQCPPEYREKSAEFEEMIATALRAWLQPLRDMQLTRPITDDFQFHYFHQSSFRPLFRYKSASLAFNSCIWTGFVKSMR